MKSLLPLFTLTFVAVLHAEPLKTGAPVPDVNVRTDKNEELNLRTATYKVSGDILTKYQGFGIDLKESSGQDAPMLPRPAVFITDQSGIIRYAYVNEDFKIRLEPEKILAAAKTVTVP